MTETPIEYPGVDYPNEQDVMESRRNQAGRLTSDETSERRRQEDIERYNAEQERQLRAIALEVARERNGESDLTTLLVEAKKLETFLLTGEVPEQQVVVPGPPRGT